jgi:hypothetical protein
MRTDDTANLKFSHSSSSCANSKKWSSSLFCADSHVVRLRKWPMRTKNCGADEFGDLAAGRDNDDDILEVPSEGCQHPHPLEGSVFACGLRWAEKHNRSEWQAFPSERVSRRLVSPPHQWQQRRCSCRSCGGGVRFECARARVENGWSVRNQCVKAVSVV